MSSRRSSLKGNSEFQRPISAALSNSFNPPLSKQSKSPLPAINSQQIGQFARPTSSTISNGALKTIVSPSDEVDLVLPAKVFKAKKTSVNDLSQAACSYLWFRRIKEIFLVMGKQNDAFSRFDMELARTDMIQTCEQYLESERPKGGGVNLVCRNDLVVKRYCFIFLFCRANQNKINSTDGKISDSMLKHLECPISGRT